MDSLESKTIPTELKVGLLHHMKEASA